MSSVLVIGGSRFVGPPLIRKLVASGDKVTVFNRGNDYGHQYSKEVKLIKGDRQNKDDLKQFSKTTFDVVYDMCCFNASEAKSLLRYVKLQSHIIFFSSAAVYKKTPIFPLEEDSELGEWPTFGDYGTGKAAAEKVYSHFAQKNNIKATMLRPVYLLGNNNYFDRENYLFSRILKDQPILMPGDGKALIQFGFLDETVEAFYNIPKLQKQSIEHVNIAGSQYLSLRDFILLCGQIVNKQPRIINVENKKHGILEEEFYDDLYPFPNVTFIVSNKKMLETYQIQTEELVSGLTRIYKQWKKGWNGQLQRYALEEKLLKVYNAL